MVSISYNRMAQPSAVAHKHTSIVVIYCESTSAPIENLFKLEFQSTLHLCNDIYTPQRRTDIFFRFRHSIRADGVVVFAVCCCSPLFFAAAAAVAADTILLWFL